MTTCQDFSKVVLRFGYTIIAAPRFWLGSTAGKSKAVIAIYRFPWGPVANNIIMIYFYFNGLNLLPGNPLAL